MTTHGFCDLCGLPLRRASVSLPGTEGYRFCCLGCKQVFSILTEATGSTDPATLRENELFKTCQEMGIIPRDEEWLDSPDISSRSGTNETLSLTLHIVGMWCPACAWLIVTSLKSLSGVAKAECHFSTDRLTCEYEPVRVSPPEIKAVVDRLGYRAVDPEEEEDGAEFRRGLLEFAICGFLTMNIMMMSFGVYSGFLNEATADGVRTLSWPIAVMAAIVLAYGGRIVFMRALRGIPFGVFSMETLVSLGAISAFLLSLHNLLLGSLHLYFDTSAMLLTLALLGKTLEGRARMEVKRELGRFFSLKPNKVRLCTEPFPMGRHVSAEHLGEGDVFRVEPGEMVVADGLIIDGSGTVDESSLTGEPAPMKKEKRMRLRSGSRVVQGWFKVKAEAVGRDSALGQMIDIVEKVLKEKGPVEGKVEAAIRWLVPIFLFLSLGTGITCAMMGKGFEEAFIRALTVLVISCPCAVGIAVPLARVAGISMAGSQGILLRNFSAFDKTRRLSAIVFDKTGTLTKGAWVLKRVFTVGAFTEAETLSMAAGIEAHSDHPIAGQIRYFAGRRGVQGAEVLRVKAMEDGLSGEFNGRALKFGSGPFLREEFRAMKAGGLAALPMENGDASYVYMSLGGQPAAIFEFGDDLKDHASEAVSRLKEMGFLTVLLSGDGDRTTRVIGGRAGVHASHGDMGPWQKAQFVRGLQERGFKVAMAGDGINDAPALSQSDLGIAVHSGGHLGREVADITLMRGAPEQVLDFLHLARRVNRKVLQNLLFSFLYNLVAIPVAMSGVLTPLVAVSAMLLSSLSVTGNTLLLLRKTG
jgi:heavy metal translocating P-type ATPase